jgi:hypothetical protein
MQRKETYWEGMYWDGIDARDIGALQLSKLDQLQVQVDQHLVSNFIRFVKDRESEKDLEKWWTTICQETEEIWAFHLWHEAVFYGSRALGIANPGAHCKTYRLNVKGELISIRPIGE